jgi:polysaccharide pyruvyl transferase WcaK-like protein
MPRVTADSSGRRGGPSGAGDPGSADKASPAPSPPCPGPARDPGAGHRRVRPGGDVLGVFGLFGAGNLGNEGSLDAMLGLLREASPSDRIVCICARPDVVRRDHGVDAIPRFRWSGCEGHGRGGALLRKAAGKVLAPLHALLHARRFKLLIVPGTGILDDFSIGPLHMPYDILVWVAAARLCRAKVAFVSVGAGPIVHPISRWLMKSAARLADYRSYRDVTSKEFMESLGLDVSRDAVYPDLAFRLPAPRGAAPPAPPVRVAVGVMRFYNWRQDASAGLPAYRSYIDKLATFIRWLLAQECRVRLVIGEDSDLGAVEDVRAALGERAGAVAFAPAYTLDDVMVQMSDAHVVVATRFHNVICALKLDKPTISIGYAKKNDVLLESMGLGDCTQRIDTLDVERLQAQFARLVTEHAERTAAIRAARLRLEEALRDQDRRLDRELLSRRGPPPPTRQEQTP